jgi:hypothetical protein
MINITVIMLKVEINLLCGNQMTNFSLMGIVFNFTTEMFKLEVKICGSKLHF